MTASFGNKGSEAKILEFKNPAEFFGELVSQAQSARGIALGSNVEFYVVNLLCDFIGNGGANFSNSLALTYAEAMESSHGKRILLLKQIGDNALFVSGFFREFFARKCFDMGYYNAMGSNAYGQLAALMSGRGKQSKQSARTYRDMAVSFSQSVEILFFVAKTTFPNNTEPTDHILSTYEAWLDTASAQLEEELLDSGIVPVPVKKVMQ